MKVKKRKPWIAVVFSFLLPGLGHVYSGKLIKGIALAFLPALLTIVFGYILILTKGSKIVLASSTIILIILFIAIVINAYKNAKNQSENYILKRFNKWYIYLVIYILFGLIILPISQSYVRTNVTQAFSIPSATMEPTLLTGDRILVDKTISSESDLMRNDIVVFDFPKDTNVKYIKRIVGLPGDEIEIKNKVLYINKVSQEENYVIFTSSVSLPKSVSPKDNFGPITVPPNAVFVMGDNRDNSSDSRFWGVVPINLVRGKFLSIYLSFDVDNSSVRWNRIGQTLVE